MAAKKKIKKEKEVSYVATIKNFGKVFTAKGPTILEAISNLQPGNVSARGILTVEGNDKKRDRILQPMVMRRLFMARGLTRDMQLKNISMLFES